MTTNSSNSVKSKKVFFLTKEEYYSVKESVNLKNFMVIPGVDKEYGGFSFYTKKSKELAL